MGYRGHGALWQTADSPQHLPAQDLWNGNKHRPNSGRLWEGLKLGKRLSLKSSLHVRWFIHVRNHLTPKIHSLVYHLRVINDTVYTVYSRIGQLTIKSAYTLRLFKFYSPGDASVNVSGILLSKYPCDNHSHIQAQFSAVT